jgi:hypothetical protein
VMASSIKNVILRGFFFEKEEGGRLGAIEWWYSRRGVGSFVHTRIPWHVDHIRCHSK